jgi:hypothetical protein
VDKYMIYLLAYLFFGLPFGRWMIGLSFMSKYQKKIDPALKPSFCRIQHP